MRTGRASAYTASPRAIANALVVANETVCARPRQIIVKFFPVALPVIRMGRANWRAAKEDRSVSGAARAHQHVGRPVERMAKRRQCPGIGPREKSELCLAQRRDGATGGQSLAIEAAHEIRGAEIGNRPQRCEHGARTLPLREHAETLELAAGRVGLTDRRLASGEGEELNVTQRVLHRAKLVEREMLAAAEQQVRLAHRAGAKYEVTRDVNCRKSSRERFTEPRGGEVFIQRDDSRQHADAISRVAADDAVQLGSHAGEGAKARCALRHAERGDALLDGRCRLGSRTDQGRLDDQLIAFDEIALTIEQSRERQVTQRAVFDQHETAYTLRLEVRDERREELLVQLPSQRTRITAW